MRLCVTGSSGYLGKRTVALAIEEGHEVVGLDVKPSGIKEGRFTEHVADVTERGAVGSAVRGCEAVLHLAAALAQFERDEERMHRVNVGGTSNVLAAAAEAGVRTVVYVSSVEVYGIDVPVPCPESAPLKPVCQYGRDKVEGEELCGKYLDRGLDVFILRPPTVNGPGQNEPFLVSQMEAISRGKATLLPGGGKTRLQMVHVDDVVSAMLLCLSTPEARGRPMNVASDDVPTLREMAQALYEHAGTRPRFININARLARGAVGALSKLGISPLEPQHLEIALRDYIFDNSLAKELLRWRPTRNDIETAVETYDWFVSEGR